MGNEVQETYEKIIAGCMDKYVKSNKKALYPTGVFIFTFIGVFYYFACIVSYIYIDKIYKGQDGKLLVIYTVSFCVSLYVFLFVEKICLYWDDVRKDSWIKDVVKAVYNDITSEIGKSKEENILKLIIEADKDAQEEKNILRQNDERKSAYEASRKTRLLSTISLIIASISLLRGYAGSFKDNAYIYTCLCLSLIVIVLSMYFLPIFSDCQIIRALVYKHNNVKDPKDYNIYYSKSKWAYYLYLYLTDYYEINYKKVAHVNTKNV